MVDEPKDEPTRASGLDAINTLQRLGAGHLIDEIFGNLVATCEDVVATGRKGSVSMTLTVQRAVKDGDPTNIVILEEVKRTPPKGVSKGAVLWAFEGEIFERDPKQKPLSAFRVVQTPDGARLRDPGPPEQSVREAE